MFLYNLRQVPRLQRRIIPAMRSSDSAHNPEPRSSDARLRAAGIDRAQVLSGVTGAQLARRIAIGLGILTVLALAIVELPGLSAVRARLSGAEPGWIMLAVALEAASVACFALATQRTFADVLQPRAAIALGTTAQGVSGVVPAGGTGGLAFAAVILTDAGLPVAFTIGRLAALFLITSVLMNLVLIVVGGGGGAVGLLAIHGGRVAAAVPAAIAVTVLVTFAALLTPRAAAWWRTVRSRTSLGAVDRALGAGGELLHSWDPRLAVAAVGYIACDLAALAAALAALGWGGLGLATVVLGYTLGQIGSVIPLPGTTESGLVGALALYGAPLTLAIPAVLIYRTVAIAVPLVLGAVGAVQLRHGLAISGAPDAAWPSGAQEPLAG